MTKLSFASRCSEFECAELGSRPVVGQANVHALVYEITAGDEPSEPDREAAISLAGSGSDAFGDVRKIGRIGGDGEVPAIVVHYRPGSEIRHAAAGAAGSEADVVAKNLWIAACGMRPEMPI